MVKVMVRNADGSFWGEYAFAARSEAQAFARAVRRAGRLATVR